ncbi:MAG TPA: class I adenylate-forming enzyme family protein [Frankiaceae bacterium]|nr:class I adenylate-forming enzyme family protein [Frankiaceae bacterium]
MTTRQPTLTSPGAYFEIGDEVVRGTRMPVFTERARSLRQLLEDTRRFSDRTYVIEGDTRLDYGTHLEIVDGLAAALRDRHGIEPGDRVAIFAGNRWEWVVAFWAIATAGAIPCAFNGFWTQDEFVHATGLVDPALIIGDSDRLARVTEATAGRSVLNLDEVRSLSQAYPDAPPVSVPAAEDDTAVLIFTSGTTGYPKAVATSHRGVVGFAQLSAYQEAFARVMMGGPIPESFADVPPSDDVILVTSPLFHTSMLYGVFVRAMLRGSAAVLLPGRFEPERVLAAIDQERVTSWLALGSTAARVCAVPDRERYDTSSLMHVGVGGAPVSPAVQEGLRETFPRICDRLSMGYASTESVATVASIGGPEFNAHPTSTGRATVTVEIELRDPSGAPVADGEMGEIHVRSPYVMLGYWNDPPASEAVLMGDGWLAMGDVGRRVDGLLYIDSRARDLILVNAENVSPTEVEYRLEAHPDITEAAVFAVDDPLTGDAVCAVVVADASAVTSEDLSTWCRDALAHYKVPTQWHVVQEPLPRTASGKLVKREIRALVEG